LDSKEKCESEQKSHDTVSLNNFEMMSQVQCAPLQSSVQIVRDLKNNNDGKDSDTVPLINNLLKKFTERSTNLEPFFKKDLVDLKSKKINDPKFELIESSLDRRKHQLSFLTLEMISDDPLSMETLTSSQVSDDYLKNLRSALFDKDRKLQNFQVIKGLLFKKIKDKILNSVKLVIALADKLMLGVISFLHENFDHPSISATIKLFQRYFYHRRASKIIKKYLKNCDICKISCENENSFLHKENSFPQSPPNNKDENSEIQKPQILTNLSEKESSVSQKFQSPINKLNENSASQKTLFFKNQRESENSVYQNTLPLLKSMVKTNSLLCNDENDLRPTKQKETDSHTLNERENSVKKLKEKENVYTLTESRPILSFNDQCEKENFHSPHGRKIPLILINKSKNKIENFDSKWDKDSLSQDEKDQVKTENFDSLKLENEISSENDQVQLENRENDFLTSCVSKPKQAPLSDFNGIALLEKTCSHTTGLSACTQRDNLPRGVDIKIDEMKTETKLTKKSNYKALKKNFFSSLKSKLFKH